MITRIQKAIAKSSFDNLQTSLSVQSATTVKKSCNDEYIQQRIAAAERVANKRRQDFEDETQEVVKSLRMKPSSSQRDVAEQQRVAAERVSLMRRRKSEEEGMLKLKLSNSGKRGRLSEEEVSELLNRHT